MKYKKIKIIHRRTRAEFEEYLNRHSPAHPDERWFIGGVYRGKLARAMTYGTALKEYDPTLFTLMYRDWVHKKTHKNE